MKRPHASLTERILFASSLELVAQIDEWRRHEHDLPNRSEAVRRLVELGLTVKRPAKPKRGKAD